MGQVILRWCKLKYTKGFGAASRPTEASVLLLGARFTRSPPAIIPAGHKAWLPWLQVSACADRILARCLEISINSSRPSFSTDDSWNSGQHFASLLQTASHQIIDFIMATSDNPRTVETLDLSQFGRQLYQWYFNEGKSMPQVKASFDILFRTVTDATCVVYDIK